MTPIEDALRRSIVGHVISIADWQRALLFLGDRGNAPHGDESFANYQFSGAMNEEIWDILTYLFVMRANDRSIFFPECCQSARVPHERFLAHLNGLVEQGFVLCTPDRSDSEDFTLQLSPRGREIVEEAIWAADSERPGGILAASAWHLPDEFIKNDIARSLNVSSSAVERHLANFREKPL